MEEKNEQMKQVARLAFINPNRRRIIKELDKLLAEWEAWSREIDQIVDQPYDHNTQLEVFADGETMMQKHEILQTKTKVFLDNNIRGHGFITGFDGSHCDRTDLRLKQRVKHRLQELRVLCACLNEVQGEEKMVSSKFTFSNSEGVWQDVEADYGVTKRAFGKKINFISNTFKRKVVFRDTEQAYILANAGFSKPAVILAGSVIEELLRLYLESKKVSPKTNDFDSYIKACENAKLLKSAIHRLTDSVRQFRNFVHLAKEVSPRHTISKANAKSAVASIFILANDFE